MTDILQHSEAGVLTLTINRPERKNALTSAMYAALAQALERAAQDAAMRVAVIQGQEAFFCAGNDIEEFLHQPPMDASSPVLRFLRAVATFPKPLLAAVCGPAVGIGTTMLLHCDLVYAGDNAAFSMPFVNLGLCVEGAASLLAPALMGYHRAAEALLLGEPLYAATALDVGLVNKVLPPSEVNAYAQQVARKLAAKPSVSLMETKRLMKGAQQDAVLQCITEEATVFARLLRGPAAKEAFQAFIEKRTPDFARV